MNIAKLNIKIDNLENSLIATVCLKNNRFEGFVITSQNSIFIKGFVNDEFMSFKLYQKDNNEISENEYTIGKNGDGKIVNERNNTSINCHVDFNILMLDEYDENLMINEIQNAIKLWKNPDQKSLLRK